MFACGSKLDAVPVIVNMPRPQRDLRNSAIAAPDRRAIQAATIKDGTIKGREASMAGWVWRTAIAVAAMLAAGFCRPRSQYPGQGRSHPRSLSTRRRRRRADAHAGRSRVEDLDAVDRGREPARRRRGDRLAGDRDLGTRRLHSDHGGERPRHQSVPLSEAALRHVQGFLADLAAGIVAERAAGPRGLAVQVGRRRHRGGEGRHRQPVVRPCRQRHLDTIWLASC